MTWEQAFPVFWRTTATLGETPAVKMSGWDGMPGFVPKGAHGHPPESDLARFQIDKLIPVAGKGLVLGEVARVDPCRRLGQPGGAPGQDTFRVTIAFEPRTGWSMV